MRTGADSFRAKKTVSVAEANADMKPPSLYEEGHLILAAIRILEHRMGTPPDVENICQMLELSIEQGNRICNKLSEKGVIRILSGAFGTKVDIADHLLIESLRAEDGPAAIQDDIEKFKASRQALTQKVASIKAEQDEKKKSLFADLEKQLKMKTEGKK